MKGTLKFINSDSTVTEIYPKTSADCVTFSDTTVANYLENFSVSEVETAETADVAETAEKDSAGNIISETYAPKNSPNFTGTPTAPTSENLDLLTDQVATVAWCNNVFKRFTGIVPENMDTLQEFWAALGEDSDLATTISTALDGKQNKSDVLTAFSNLTFDADKIIYATGEKTFSTTALTQTAREIISKSTAKEIRRMLGIYKNPFFDERENTWVKFNEPYISNVNKKFGAKALQTNGGGIYTPTRLEFGGADFTIGFFAKLDSDSGLYAPLFCACSSGDWDVPSNRHGEISLLRHNTNNSLELSIYDSQSNSVVSSGEINFDPTDNIHYYEIDYNHTAQTIKLFADTQLIFSQSNVSIERLERFLTLGFLPSNLVIVALASVDEFFLLDGTARSSETCTPPTEPLEVGENTLSLLHFD